MIGVPFSNCKLDGWAQVSAAFYALEERVVRDLILEGKQIAEERAKGQQDIRSDAGAAPDMGTSAPDSPSAV